MALKWERTARETIRSDSHQLVVDVAHTDFYLHGSPARVVEGHNVFGSGDPVQCALAMIRFAALHTGISLPEDVTLWRVTRMDVTQSYDLGSPAEVRQALSYLRQSEGGRYQVRTASETVYWSRDSALRSGKAYHKGPHLRYQAKKRQVEVTPEEIGLADRLLRLELSLKSQFWRERSGRAWYEYSEDELEAIHTEFFGRLIGKVEVVEMDSLLERFDRVAPTKGQALAAYRTWSLIRVVGVREAEASMPRATWFRHRKVMFAAGLTFADLHAGNVVPFRRRIIELGKPVRSWAEVARAA